MIHLNTSQIKQKTKNDKVQPVDHIRRTVTVVARVSDFLYPYRNIVRHGTKVDDGPVRTK